MTVTTTADNEPGQPLGLPLNDGLGPLPERWYVLDADGLATLCKDEADAREAVSGYWSLYPRRGPYRAVLLGDVAAERERWRSAVFALWDCSREAAPDMEPDEYAAWLAVGEILKA